MSRSKLTAAESFKSWAHGDSVHSTMLAYAPASLGTALLQHPRVCINGTQLPTQSVVIVFMTIV